MTMRVRNILCSVVALIASSNVLVGVSAFATSTGNSVSTKTRTAIETTTTTSLSMAEDNNDFMRWARASRSAGAEDNVVDLMRPLGLVLSEDDNGNVFVETLAPRGNAARTGQVKEGDIVTMCSATFGGDMWSTRGVGLSRVLAAIRVRAGPTVSLVFESPTGYKKKKIVTEKQLLAREQAEKVAQRKKDSLLAELESDEERLGGGGGKKKFFGLF